jgi:hypothetical protein
VACGALPELWILPPTLLVAIAEMLRRHEPAHQEVVSMHDELAALMDEREWERLAGAFGGHVDSRY